VQLLPGRGEVVAARLIADARVKGVMFTGSTEVARIIQRALAERGNVPLIAETGGQNCMIVDSTALTEQVVADALASAFDSAGQRCSALRVLCLQEEIAGKVLDMLQGAMAELEMGDPAGIATDVGPVIDADAKANLEKHIARMRPRVRYQVTPPRDCDRGTFVAPTLIEIGSISELEREVFGPVLHVVRYSRDELDRLVNAIHATGYGLTLGIHTRIDETVDFVVERVRVGNVYVNRNIVGAVVGVQPFGGERLSGTGPKAGGPLYLHRLLRETPGPRLSGERHEARLAPLTRLIDWLRGEGARLMAEPMREAMLARLEGYGRESLVPLRITLPGPVGEDNTLSFAPRGVVLGTARSTAAAVHQLGAALATGNQLILVEGAETRTLLEALPSDLRDWIALRATGSGEEFGAALFESEGARTDDGADRWRRDLADRPGPTILLVEAAPAYDLERLIVERSLSVNTTAAGGNTHLMTLGTETGI
jgi:RHH-type transcriptional regulator, proline utilization regulon repressor / proline dehydrogenase / delta 1-pyrroline-5-carboxylate dehydrogenase